MRRIKELYAEIDEREGELSRLISGYEGREVKFKGKEGVIRYIDAPNERATVDFFDGTDASVTFEEIGIN